jgi:predicted Zn finger-like uncharacterized protein
VYTQCPDCATVFRVTVDVLRTAQGNVRCGVCSTSFDALENLSEVPFRATLEGEQSPTLEDTITVEETPGNENIELSTSAEAVSSQGAASESDSADPAPIEEQLLEFNADIDDLDRVFVRMPETEVQHLAAVVRATEPPSLKIVDPGAIAASLTVTHHDLDSTDEHPILVLDESDELPEEPIEIIAYAPEPEPRPRPQPRPQVQPEPERQEFEASPYGKPRILIPDDMREGLAKEAAASAIHLADFDEPEPDAGPRRWRWALGIAFLVLALGAQVVHGQRDKLIRNPAIGPLLVEIYSFVGAPFTDPTDLAAYELRQWGAASDAMQPGRLLLRASIVNRADYAQPYPLLRLALQDRFGTTVGVRDIDPADYLPGMGTANLLEPGQRADAEIRIVDPGKDAVGFEMDVCLKASAGVRCANEARPAAQ